MGKRKKELNIERKITDDIVSDIKSAKVATKRSNHFFVGVCATKSIALCCNLMREDSTFGWEDEYDENCPHCIKLVTPKNSTN